MKRSAVSKVAGVSATTIVASKRWGVERFGFKLYCDPVADRDRVIVHRTTGVQHFSNSLLSINLAIKWPIIHPPPPPPPFPPPAPVSTMTTCAYLHSPRGGRAMIAVRGRMVDNCIIMLTQTADKKEEKMWKTALDVSEDDKWMIDAWIEDSNGILAFVSLNLLARLFIILMRSLKTGLLSATIGAFIIEFYKKLSPDSGDQTVDLLGQISQQLANSRNDTSITAADQPFSPGAHLIWVNAMWLISLVFSVTSALITSLNQQAVRRYIEMLKKRIKPKDHARLRLLLFRGITLYKMPLATLAAPTLLHLSIILFLGGLVIVFHTIYQKVAIAVDVAVGVSGLVYMAMSLIPLLDLKCPYRTPVTYLLQYLWDAFRFLASYCRRLPFAKQLPACSCLSPCLCTCLVPLDSDGSYGAGSGKQYLLPGLSNSLVKAVE
jgi:hypothetical protein